MNLGGIFVAIGDEVEHDDYFSLIRGRPRA